MKTLVLGAGGFLGLNIVDALRSLGEEPLCGRRARSNVIPLRSRKVQMVTTDLDQVESLRAAMRGVEVVVHAAGYYPRFSLDYDGALARGVSQLRSVLDAAADVGVRRVVYVSSTATVARRSSGPSTEADVFAASPRLGLYHDLKWAMESVAVAERRLEVLVACPGACIGPWDLRVGTSALLVGLARGIDPPHPDGVVNIVDARDVGQLVARMALTHGSTPRRLLMAAHNRGLHEMLVELAERYGAPSVSLPLPVEEAERLASEEEAHCQEHGGRPSISREIVDLIAHGVLIDASLAERTFDVRWRSWTETLDAFDEWARRMRLIPDRPHHGSIGHERQPVT